MLLELIDQGFGANAQPSELWSEDDVLIIMCFKHVAVASKACLALAIFVRRLFGIGSVLCLLILLDPMQSQVESGWTQHSSSHANSRHTCKLPSGTVRFALP